ncbi:MAG TPA: DUF5522 domain-containing protein [Bacteriovoracaceae bacterium]|nr:DUF5522 domain-containing protein [Bacteriovoracaceae bacterium]
MQKELSYLTPEGYTIFTSHYLKNKGTCCKSACLHCPYGFTLKKLGLQFAEVAEPDFSKLEDVLSEAGSSSFEWKSFWPQNVRFILIKDVICGVMFKNHIVVKHVFLKPHFTNQDLSKELIESYFFI